MEKLVYNNMKNAFSKGKNKKKVWTINTGLV